MLTHQKILKVKVNAGFLSLKSQLQPCNGIKTVEPIRKLLIKNAYSNFYIQLGHMGSMLYNFVTNSGICIFHPQHQNQQHIMSADAYDWAQTQAGC